jgi:tRNA U34 5-carboxymethylaminomethyl modifying GTPase MnmE/TrmE
MTRTLVHEPGRWTPPGAGGVAVLTMGEDARARRSLLRMGIKHVPAPGELRLVRLRDGDEDLDEALLVTAPDGRVELHVHGSTPLVARIQSLLDADEAPVQTATHAERSALALPDAPSEMGARILLDQANGAFDRALASGEDHAALRDRGRAARFLLERTRVVIAGPVNAGKSTLFNVLVGSERATVSAESGTTRDAVRADGRLGPWPIEWVDTAGERDVDAGVHGARVERAGQKLGRALAADAHLVIWLEPEGNAGQASLPANVPHLVRLTSRATDPRAANHVAALEDPAGARARVAAAFAEHFGLDASDAWTPGRAVPFDGPSRAGVGGSG